MSSIDDRIVRLELQDTDFAKRIENDEEALKKLNKTLGDVGGSSMANNLQKITDKFSNLGIIGVRALQNITDRAMAAGEQLVKSLSVDNIYSGWSKFEDETKAVGTLVSQGFKIEDVNKQIEELQWYTDETSYNFNDMLTAVSKFTAQGVSLQDSVSALEGIANWAAIAGQNAEAGSRAMRELSQVMGVGFVRYQDWSSIQTLMMDYDGLRDMILDTAVAMGTLKKNANGTYESLRATTAQGMEAFTKEGLAGSLTTGKWFTSDVLTSVLKQFSEAVDPVYEYMQKNNVTASEAMEALRGSISDVAIGFFEAAQEARTLGDAIGSVKEGVSSTWQQTFKLIFGDYEQQKTLWTDLSERLYEVFVEGGNVRNELLQTWSDLGGRDKLIQSFWNLLDAGVKIIDTIKQAWQNIFPPKTAEQLYSMTEKFEALTQKLILNDERAEKLGRTFQGIFSIFRLGKDILQAVLKPIASLLGSSGSLIDNILTITQAIGDWITNGVYWLETNDKIKISMELLANIISGLWKIIKTVGGGFLYVFKGIGDVVSDLVKGTKDLKTSFTDAFSAPISKLKDFTDKLKKTNKETDKIVEIPLAYAEALDVFEEENVDDAPKKINKITEAFKKLGEGIKNVHTNYVKPIFDRLSEMIGLTQIFSNGLISGVFKIISIVFAVEILLGIGKIIFSIGEGIANLISGLTGIVGIIGSINQSIKAGALLKAAIAIGILTASLYALLNLDLKDITEGISRIGEIADTVSDAINKISLSSAAGLALLAKVNLWPLIITIGAVAAAAWGLYVASDIFKDFGKSLANAFSEENCGRILDFLQRFGEVLSTFSWGLIPVIGVVILNTANKIKKAAKTFTGISTTINIFKSDTSWAAKLLKLAAAIGIVVASIYVVAEKIDPEKLQYSFDTVALVAGLMTTLSIALGFITKGIGTTDYAKPLLQMAEAIGLMTLVAALLGYLVTNHFSTMVAGLAAVTVFGLVVDAFVKFGSKTNAERLKGLKKVFSAVGGAVAAISVSMLILAGAMRIISGIGDFTKIAESFAPIGMAIIEIAAALAIVSKVADSSGKILAVGGAFTIMSIGIVILAAALTELASVAGDGKLIEAAESLGIVVGIMAVSLAAMAGIGTLFEHAWQLVAALATGIAAFAGLGFVISKVLTWLSDPLKKFAEGVDAFSNISAGTIAKMAAAVGVIMAIGAIGGIPLAIPLLVLTGVLYLLSKVLEGAMESFVVFCEGISTYGESAAQGITSLGTSIKNAILDIADAIVEAKVKLITWPLAVFEAINESGKGLISSVSNMLKEDSESVGFNLTAGLAAGMVSPQAMGIFSNSTKDILLRYNDDFGVHSPSEDTYETGYWMTVGQANGMTDRSALDKIGDACSVISSWISKKLGKGTQTLLGETIPQSVQSSVASATKDATVEASTRLLGDFIGEETANSLATSFGENTEAGTIDVLKYLSGSDSNLNYAASLWGGTMGAAAAKATVKTLGEYVSKVVPLAQGALAGVSAKFNLGETKIVDVQMPGKPLSPEVDTSDAENKIQTAFSKLYNEIEETVITPVFDSSSWDDLYNKVSSQTKELKTDLEPERDVSKLEDWELTMDELIRKYSTLSRSYYDGQWHDFWTYNGPMGGVVEEGEVEWVFEGPRSGYYQKETDTYFADIQGHLEDVKNWNDHWADIYYGYESLHSDQLDTIGQNTDMMNSSILDQTALQELYNQQMQDQLSSISSQLGDLNTNVTGLGNDFGNFGVYLDGKTLVGQLTDQIDQSLGNKQALVSRGVKR